MLAKRVHINPEQKKTCSIVALANTRICLHAGFEDSFRMACVTIVSFALYVSECWKPKYLHDSVGFSAIVRIEPSSTRMTWSDEYSLRVEKRCGESVMPMHGIDVIRSGASLSCVYIYPAILTRPTRADQAFSCPSCRSPKSLTVIPHMPMTLDMTIKLTTIFPFSHSSSTLTVLRIFLLLAHICSLTLS